MSSDADRIRNLALSEFVEPARKRGDASVTITAREVHDRLGLSAAHANVCQALAGRRFLELAGLPAPKMSGPMASSTTTFTYDLKSGPITEIDKGPYWLVGSAFGRKDDQTERFLAEGIWEVDGPSDSDKMHIQAMKPGQKIAIKSTFVQRHGLPFDNRAVGVSAMRIKARGVITANPGKNARIEVAWEAHPEPRDWYFFTNRQTIWRLEPDTKFSIALIRFTFEDAPQDLQLFLADDYWPEADGPQRTSLSEDRKFVQQALASKDRLQSFNSTAGSFNFGRLFRRSRKAERVTIRSRRQFPGRHHILKALMEMHRQGPRADDAAKRPVWQSEVALLSTLDPG